MRTKSHHRQGPDAAVWKLTRVYYYRISGLLVASDLALTGASPAEPGFAERGPGESADVAICAAPPPPSLANPTRSGPNWAMAPGDFLLEVPGVVRFRLSGGRRISYEAAPDATPGDVAAFVMGAAFGVLLHQRGVVVLNAASVLVDGRAVILMGGSGVGKSTLAAALEARGYPVIADDLCVVGVGPDGGPRLVGDGAQLKLWRESIDALRLAARRGPRVRAALGKFHLQRASPAPGGPAPLGAVYAVCEARAPFAPGITRPNIVDATLLVRASAYRPPLIDLMGQAAAYFAAAVAFGNAGGVFLLRMPDGFDGLDEALDGLERHLGRRDSLAGAA